MTRGRKTALTLRLTPRERLTLLAWQRSTTMTLGRARRARIILLLADGMPIAHIAATVGISRRFVYKWAKRFLEEGIEGLADRPGRGFSPRTSRPGSIQPDERRAAGTHHAGETG
ncbi:MAG TPA: helix-turn-helix domain-containing protein [Candidatus Tectomicrobia bacterium]